MADYEGLDNLTPNAKANLRRASMVGKRAGKQLSALLLRHSGSDIITPQQREELVTAEERKTADEFITDRITGKRNNLFSLHPGLTALVCESVVENSKEIFADTGLMVERTGMMIEVAMWEEEELQFMRLPDGWFRIRALSVSLYAEALGCDEEGTIIGPGYSYEPFLRKVLRVEGDDGQYWQNPERHFAPYNMHTFIPTPVELFTEAHPAT